MGKPKKNMVVLDTADDGTREAFDVSQSEILDIVAATAEEKCNTGIQDCKNLEADLRTQIKAMELQAVDILSSAVEAGSFDINRDLLIQLAGTLKSLGAGVLIGSVPLKQDRHSDLITCDAIGVVLTILPANYQEQRAKYGKQDPEFNFSTALAAQIPGSVSMHSREALYAYDREVFGVNFKLGLPQEFCDLQAKHRELDKRLDDVVRDRHCWEDKKKQIPSLERTYRAKIATAKLKATDAGQRVLKNILSNLDNDILNLTTA